MSTHIVDQVRAFVLPFVEPKPPFFGATQYIVAELGGDDNVINTRTRKRAKHWAARAVGSEWEVLARACRIAAACCGGCLRFYGERRTKPENYIARWRKALASAVELSEARTQGFVLRAQARFWPKEESLELLEELAKQREVLNLSFYGQPVKVVQFEMTNLEDCAIWLETIQRNRDKPAEDWLHIGNQREVITA